MAIRICEDGTLIREEEENLNGNIAPNGGGQNRPRPTNSQQQNGFGPVILVVLVLFVVFYLYVNRPLITDSELRGRSSEHALPAQDITPIAYIRNEVGKRNANFTPATGHVPMEVQNFHFSPNDNTLTFDWKANIAAVEKIDKKRKLVSLLGVIAEEL